jgi:hypothetical protein
MKRHLIQPTILRKGLLSLAVVITAALGNSLHAQQKVNDGTVPAAAINASAIAEYQTNNKGILLPRVALTSTTAAAPLAAHVAGMTVYNTAIDGTPPTNVTPGWYYNDGSRWVRLAVTDNNVNVFGSGAPTGACSPNTIYTDTSLGSPTVGQQFICNGGTWISYVNPVSTEWYFLGTVNDAGSSKNGHIYRNASTLMDYTPGALSPIFGFTKNSAGPTFGIGGHIRMNANEDLILQNYQPGKGIGTAGNSFSVNTATTAVQTGAALSVLGTAGNSSYVLSLSDNINFTTGISGKPGNIMMFEGLGSTRYSFYTNNNGINPGERLVITAPGDVGIGTTAPTALLSVNGAANNTTGAWGVFSDARVKTVDAEFTDGLNVINKIRPVKFHYNASAPFAAAGQQVGVVAQELEKIAPYMVSTINYKGEKDKTPIADLREVNNQAYIFLLINAVKEQQQQIEALKAEVSQLKK